MDARSHWDAMYRTKAPDHLSWFQADPRTSLALIERAVAGLDACIIDVGGGASTLADRLLGRGYRHLTVLDLSAAALEAARQRLGAAAADVTWIEADVLTVSLPHAAFDLWHDRAVFHFLTSAADRARYADQVRCAVRPGGHLVIATFAEDGPTRCSGLPVVRYAPETLQRQLGAGFTLVESTREEHVTPDGVRQRFIYARLRFDGAPARE